jgi:hypothetical protein
MYQGGDGSLQDLCGPFDSGLLHERLGDTFTRACAQVDSTMGM